MPWIIKKPKGFFQYVPPAFITLLLLIGQLSFGMLDSYIRIVIVSICTAMIAEIILARLIVGKWKSLASAYISGISVGYFDTVNYGLAIYCYCCFSILSKYVLRYKGKHLWNPSNFGVSWMLFFVPMDVAGLSIQWGSNFLAMAVIWILGLALLFTAQNDFMLLLPMF